MSLKKKTFVNHRHSIKICFVHDYRYHAIWGNTDVLGQNGRGQVNRSRPTHMTFRYKPTL